MKKSKAEGKRSKNLTADNPEGSGALTTIINKLYPIILIIFVGALCYSNNLYGPFVFDDVYNIVEDEGIHLDNFSSAELDMLKETIMKKSQSRPIARISFALNYYFGGLNTFGYHLVNIFIHLMCAILVYFFLKLTLNLPLLQDRYGRWAQEIASLSGLFFVAHPVQTQAVTYIVQRMASMAALFYLAALYFYAKARMAEGKMRISYFALCTLATLFALGSKENSGTLPFFIILYEYFFLQSGSSKKAKKNLCYLLVSMVLMFGLFVWTYDLIGFIENEYKKYPFTPGQRMLTELRVVTFYVSLLIAPLPSRLNLEHDFYLSYSLFNPPITLLCFFLILAMIAGSIYLAKKRPLISFAIIWFWGNLVLESSFLPLDLIFEHRLYLPSMGFFLLASIVLVKGIEWLGLQAQAKQRIKIGLMLVLIVLLSILTYQRNEVWGDDLKLWADTVSKSPLLARPQNNLGYSLQERERYSEAVARFQRSLEISPGYVEANYNLAYVYEKQGKFNEAIQQYKKTLEMDPGNDKAYSNLGNIYAKQGKSDKAINEYLKEVERFPDSARGFFNLGLAYQNQGELEKAIVQYRRSLQLSPGLTGVHNNLGNIYLSQGKKEQAATEYLEEIKQNPNMTESYYNLGNIYQDQGRLKEAVAQYQSVLERDSKHKDAHLNLGHVYWNQGQLEKAITHFRRTVEIDPGHIEAHNSLGCVYNIKGLYEEAKRELLKVIQLDPKHPGAYYNLGLVYFKQKLVKKAIEAYQQDLILDPDDAKTRYELGRVYASQGLYEKAISEYKKAIALAPEDAKIYNALGLAFVRNKMYREAEETFLKILIIDGDSFSAREKLGNVYYLWGMKKKAIDEWKKALIIDPHNKALQKNLEILVQQVK